MREFVFKRLTCLPRMNDASEHVVHGLVQFVAHPRMQAPEIDKLQRLGVVIET